MEWQESIKKQYLGLRENNEGVTHLSVYLFYIKDAGFQLEVWPMKKSAENHVILAMRYNAVVGYPGKCVTLIKPTGDDIMDTINKSNAINLFPLEKEKLVNEILNEHNWQLSGEIVNE